MDAHELDQLFKVLFRVVLHATLFSESQRKHRSAASMPCRCLLSAVQIRRRQAS